jgi:hypothetical protein
VEPRPRRTAEAGRPGTRRAGMHGCWGQTAPAPAPDTRPRPRPCLEDRRGASRGAAPEEDRRGRAAGHAPRRDARVLGPDRARPCAGSEAEAAPLLGGRAVLCSCPRGGRAGLPARAPGGEAEHYSHLCTCSRWGAPPDLACLPRNCRCSRPSPSRRAMLAVIPAFARPTSTNLFCRCPSRPSSSIPCLRRGRPSLAATRGLLQASAQGGAVAHGVRLHAPCNPSSPCRHAARLRLISLVLLPPSFPRGLLPPHGVVLDCRRLKPPRLATATPPAVWIRSWGGRTATARSNGGADLAVFEQFERMVHWLLRSYVFGYVALK